MFQAIAEAIGLHDTVEVALLDDMFTRRKQAEIHPSLAVFATALSHMHNLVVLDFRFFTRGRGHACG